MFGFGPFCSRSVLVALTTTPGLQALYGQPAGIYDFIIYWGSSGESTKNWASKDRFRKRKIATPSRVRPRITWLIWDVITMRFMHGKDVSSLTARNEHSCRAVIHCVSYWLIEYYMYLPFNKVVDRHSRSTNQVH